MTDTLGIISLVPTLTVIVLAIISRRPLQSLLAGVMLGYLMTQPTQPIAGLSDGIVKVMSESTTGWLIAMIGLFGSFITLLVRSGGAQAFSRLLVRKVKNRAQAVLATWVLGLIVFVDDYLNVLAISSSMKRLTDRFKVSREMLAYIVDSTAAPVCILIPTTSWAVYVIGLLESNAIADIGLGFALYLEAIPYMLYAWLCVLMVPLVGIGLIPTLGPMKAAETRTAAGNEPADEQTDASVSPDAKASDFIIPMLTLALSLWLFDADLLQSILFTVLFTSGYFLLRRRMPWNTIVSAQAEGFQQMLPVLGIVIASFLLRDVNDAMGLADYFITSVQPLMSREWMPFITFVVLASIAFATGSFWGMYAVALPIVVPLAQSMDVPLPLIIGVIVSAGAFGSHACFYGDSTVLAAHGSGCSPLAHAFTQLPYALIAALLAACGFYWLV